MTWFYSIMNVSKPGVEDTKAKRKGSLDVQSKLSSRTHSIVQQATALMVTNQSPPSESLATSSLPELRITAIAYQSPVACGSGSAGSWLPW